MNIIKIFFVIIQLILFSSLYGQEQNPDSIQTGQKKNIIYGTFGTVISEGAANVNYERMIVVSNNGFITSYWGKVAYGVSYETLTSDEPHFIVGITALTGQGNKHIELNIGFTSSLKKTDYNYQVDYARQNNLSEPSKSEYRKNSIAGGIGYRFQKPNGDYIFRTGIGIPETFYVSFGLCF